MARRGIFVPMLEADLEALFTLADREWRRPVDQAAKFIIEGLRASGALHDGDTGPCGCANHELKGVANDGTV